jgi:hypothetical protein
MISYKKYISVSHWCVRLILPGVVSHFSSVPGQLKGHGNEADFLGFLQKLDSS